MADVDGERKRGITASYTDVGCGLTIGLGAFLLFQVQPLLSKTLLPWFGGSPAVWTTCALFFQVLLLVGYGYADLLERISDTTQKAWLHLAMLGVACLFLPITRGLRLPTTASEQPVTQILWLLLVSVGFPYLVLASTGPLIQAWFAQFSPGRSPYRLYSLSNVGSLVALLSYPIVVEPVWSLPVQGWIWSVGFLLYCVLSAWLATALKHGTLRETRAEARPTKMPVGWLTIVCNWFCLPALASMMLLAITNQLCQNVAVVPLLWIAPLSIYLISFILCFDHPRWYGRLWFSVAAAFFLLAICKFLLADRLSDSVWYVEPAFLRDAAANQLVQITTYLAALFCICMMCHGEMVRSKPPPQWLTRFYFTTASGGAVGGLIVSVLCPRAFSSYAELKVGLVASFALAATLLLQGGHWRLWTKPRQRLGAMVLAIASAFVVMAQISPDTPGMLAQRRNFYGVLSVREQGTAGGGQVRFRSMYSGGAQHGAITLHGRQFLGPEYRHRPTLYYGESSGIGVVFRSFPKQTGRHVGIVGLGVGTLATYGKAGDVFDFLEVNPLVEELARQYFTCLDDSAAATRVVLGDGRRLLEQMPGQSYDILVIDAFSGDTIPTHLLTTEAFQIYLQKHLAPGGILAIHVSNRHMNLIPTVAAQAERLRVPIAYIKTSQTEGLDAYGATWVLLSENESFWNQPDVLASAQRVPDVARHDRPWTDQNNTILRLLVRGDDYLKREINQAPYLGDKP